jgi:hypothetical protein
MERQWPMVIAALNGGPGPYPGPVNPTPPTPARCAPLQVPATAPRQITQYASSCGQGSRDACRALRAYYQAGCQMGKEDDCCPANTLLGLGY